MASAGKKDVLLLERTWENVLFPEIGEIMSAPMTEAMKTAKQIQTEMVQWEGRVDIIKADVERLTKSKESLQAEIDRKTADYNIYIAQRDSETKRQREETMAERDQLGKDKTEFMDILKKHQNEKASFEEQKKGWTNDQAKLEERLNAIKTFVGAIQRAITVLGL